MSIHEGHRQRLKERFRLEGLDNFNDINVLELLLFYCVPRQDTNPLAHRLLDTFGSLSQVLSATPEALEKVEGVGENVSTFLMLMREVVRRYWMDTNSQEDYLIDLKDCGKFLMPYFLHKRNEMVYLLCLDAKCKVIGCRLVGEGSVNSAMISIRKIVETALAANATTVVLAHNHPGGFAIPSHEDKETTLRVARALKAVDITLADHVIIADNEMVSMMQSKLYDPKNVAAVY